MKCLVTGAAGFIGKHLALRLIDEGYQVTGVDNHVNSIPDESLPFPVIHGSFDGNILGDIEKQKYDIVFHLAALPRVSYSTTYPVRTSETNIMATIRLLTACRGNIKRFIFSSSSSVYGNSNSVPFLEEYSKNPESIYALQKATIEDFCRMFSKTYGLDTVCLRFFNVFGPKQIVNSSYATAISMWCHSIKNKVPLRSDGTGEQRRDLCYVDNTVDGCVLAAKYKQPCSGNSFNIACGKNYSNNEVLARFRDRFGALDIVHAPERVGDVKETLACLDLAETQLGYRAKVSFDEGLEKTWKWWGL